MPRVHCPEACSKAKEVDIYLFTSVPMEILLKLFRTLSGNQLSFCGAVAETFFFAQLFSCNQLSIYGAVSDVCEECDSCHGRTGRLVLVGQSHPLFVPTSSLMKTPTPSTEDAAQENLLQKYKAATGKALATGPIDKNLY